MPVDSEQSDDVSDVSPIDTEETESDPLPTDSDHESNSELTEQQNELEKKKPHLLLQLRCGKDIYKQYTFQEVLKNT